MLQYEDQKRKVDHFTCWFAKVVTFQAGLCSDGFSANQHIAGFFFFVELEKYNLKKVGGTVVPCLFSAALILSDGSKEANTVLPQAEIPSIKTRRNLKSLHLGCKVCFILFYLLGKYFMAGT